MSLIICIKLTGCRPKKTALRNSGSFWSVRIWRQRNEAHSSKKTPQTILSWWNQFWNTIENFFVTLRTRTLQKINLTHIWKKLIPTNLAVIFANTSKKNRSVSNFFRLCLNNNWGHCPSLVCISPSVHFLSSLRRPEKQSWNQQGHQRPRYLRGSTNVNIGKSITAVNGVEHQKRV